MRPLSADLRERILKKRDAGYGPTDISSLFGVSLRALYRLYCLYARTGRPRPQNPARERRV